MKNNVEYYKEFSSSRLLWWTIGFILFLPIIIIPPNFQPSDWTRVILFKVVLTLLVSFLLYRVLYKRDTLIAIPKKGWLFYLPLAVLLAYLVINLLATVFSEDPTFSIFGSPSRAGGILNLLFFFVFTVLLAIFIKDRSWNKLMDINFIAGILASLLAIVQYFGLFKNIFLGFETGSTPSFLGNSTFLAIYMIFLVFSSFTLFVSEGNKKRKLIYAGLFLLFLFTVFITGSRASYLGIIAGFTFYFLFFPVNLIGTEDRLFLFINPKRLKIFKIIVVFFILLVVLALIYVNLSPKLPNIIENNKRLSYFIHNRLSFKVVAEDLAGTRLSAWKITLNAIKEKPLLGWGPENFHIGFEKYFDPTLPPSLQRLWFDRPHNVFLEVLVSSGILALIVYIAFWAVLLWQLQTLKTKNGSKKITYSAHGLQAMFLGYLIALFFNFDSFSTYLISFFFVGYSLYFIAEGIEKVNILPRWNLSHIKKPAAVVYIILVALFFWFWNAKPLYFNEKIVLAQNLAKSRQCKKAIEAANSSDWSKSGIAKSHNTIRYADIIKDCTYVSPEKETAYSKKAIDMLKIGSASQPKFSRNWLYLGAFANILAAREENKEIKKNILSESRVYLDKALELSPGRQEVFIEIEKNYLLAEDYESMVKTSESCIAVDKSRGECYWYLGIAQIFMGDQENGKKNIALSKKNDYNNPPYLQLGIAYISQKNYKDAAEVYELLTAIYPQNTSYHATLAVLHKENKSYIRAAQSAITVFKLEPYNPETLQFVEELLGLAKESPELHTSLAYIYRGLGRQEDFQKEINLAIFLHQQNINRYPDSPNDYFNLAVVYKDLGEYDKAADLAFKAYQLDKGFKKDVLMLLKLMPDRPKVFEHIEFITLN